MKRWGSFVLIIILNISVAKYDLDFQFLTHIADVILVMPNWEMSWGEKREVEWAQKNGMKIFYPKDPADIKDIVKWAKAQEA